jgi:hypothetical protein
LAATDEIDIGVHSKEVTFEIASIYQVIYIIVIQRTPRLGDDAPEKALAASDECLADAVDIQGGLTAI